MTTLKEKKAISLALSAAIADACVAEASSTEVPVSIAVCDDGGNLVYFRRMEGSGFATIAVAQDKAFCAASTKTPTDAWYDIARSDPAFGFGLSSLPRFCPLAGGLPVLAAEEVIGALGVSGGSNSQDLAIAQAGLRAAAAFLDEA